ncbi:MAG: 1,2-diacylglycerol 3-glucosyltransferase [Candidatus Tectimicrobiota bacterium]|nr:MAG: 1,2-diacylglycerol 3-glucosyltransferase [Candidatus Tectomicrobia bacterium]
MRILMLNYEYPPLGGGGGVLNRDLAEALSQEHAITLLTSRYDGLPAREVCGGVEIVRVPVWGRHDPQVASLRSMLSFFPSSLGYGWRLLRRQRVDVVHSLFAVPSAPSGFLLARHFGVPHLLSILGGDIYDPSKRLSPHRHALLRALVRHLLRASDAVVGMSTDIIAHAQSRYGITRDIVKIPHGIRRPVYSRTCREALGYRAQELLLVTVGRLVPRKATHELLDVVARLHGVAFKLLIIGDGPEKSRLQQQAAQQGLGDRVAFLGSVSDEVKFQVLSVADIYVSTTQHEGFGLMFLEAMACGLPIVSYDHGGHVDFLIDGKTGFLVRLGDRALFAHRLQELCDHAPLRREMGQFNRAYVEEFYIERCAQKYSALYRALAASRGPGKEGGEP